MSQIKNTQKCLIINDLKVKIEDRDVVKGITLTVEPGKVHALMGPNGTGKSTLALALMGHPRYEIHEGSVLLGDQDLLAMDTEERARAGLFLAMQYPSEIPGVPFNDFLRSAHRSLGKPRSSPRAFRNLVKRELEGVGMDAGFALRYLNEGFSGGEKKRSEVVQARVLQPRFVVLDEIDSGLDIDALKAVAASIEKLRGAGTGVLIITHYSRILHHLPPDHVHVMSDGRIVKSAPGLALAETLEAEGYEALVSKQGVMA
jgi:Fe-S cluster assembly ATP-binding protein